MRAGEDVRGGGEEVGSGGQEDLIAWQLPIRSVTADWLYVTGLPTNRIIGREGDGDSHAASILPEIQLPGTTYRSLGRAREALTIFCLGIPLNYLLWPAGIWVRELPSLEECHLSPFRLLCTLSPAPPLLRAETRPDNCRPLYVHALSDNKTVALWSVNLQSSGMYRCEVSAEAPSFASAQREARMEVICEYVMSHIPHATQSSLSTSLSLQYSNKIRLGQYWPKYSPSIPCSHFSQRCVPSQLYFHLTPSTPALKTGCRGGVVVRLLALSPKRTGFDSRVGSLPDFRMWESCRRYRWSAGVLGDPPLPFFIPWEPCPHISGVGWPTCSRGVVGSHPGPSEANLQLACRTGNLSAKKCYSLPGRQPVIADIEKIRQCRPHTPLRETHYTTAWRCKIKHYLLEGYCESGVFRRPCTYKSCWVECGDSAGHRVLRLCLLLETKMLHSSTAASVLIRLVESELGSFRTVTIVTHAERVPVGCNEFNYGLLVNVRSLVGNKCIMESGHLCSLSISTSTMVRAGNTVDNAVADGVRTKRWASDGPTSALVIGHGETVMTREPAASPKTEARSVSRGGGALMKGLSGVPEVLGFSWVKTRCAAHSNVQNKSWIPRGSAVLAPVSAVLIKGWTLGGNG
ncbi:hypothetical protein PR048_008123 [Dryococelus australis]|uniref:Ig-like domain-containing protein n=1 Tax=Dryococelus australis TaxID=614101 RepID=A0ABQ9HW79_9NEOP|nr:hypothetical protein PR048_008123 [Dryococelus australis]